MGERGGRVVVVMVQREESDEKNEGEERDESA